MSERCKQSGNRTSELPSALRGDFANYFPIVHSLVRATHSFTHLHIYSLTHFALFVSRTCSLQSLVVVENRSKFKLFWGIVSGTLLLSLALPPFSPSPKQLCVSFSSLSRFFPLLCSVDFVLTFVLNRFPSFPILPLGAVKLRAAILSVFTSQFWFYYVCLSRLILS